MTPGFFYTDSSLTHRVSERKVLETHFPDMSLESKTYDLLVISGIWTRVVRGSKVSVPVTSGFFSGRVSVSLHKHRISFTLRSSTLKSPPYLYHK